MCRPRPGWQVKSITRTGAKLEQGGRSIDLQLSSGDGMTQFGRALSELNIEILCANPRFLQVECLQEELFCKKLQNRRNLSLRREYASARMALGGAPFVVIRQEELR
jgi:hypothetical protein